MARKANIHSTPGMFQNWSVPLTRLLNPLTPDSVLPESRRAGTSLSSGTHRTAYFRPRATARPSRQLHQAQFMVEIFHRVKPGPAVRRFVLRTQPLSEPVPGVGVHTPAGFTHRSQPKVIRPSYLHAVQIGNHFLGVGAYVNGIRAYPYYFNLGRSVSAPTVQPNLSLKSRKHSLHIQ